MRPAYAEIDISILNELLDITGAKIIGGKVVAEKTLRLYLILDEPKDPFDNNFKHVDLSDFAKRLDKQKSGT